MPYEVITWHVYCFSGLTSFVNVDSQCTYTYIKNTAVLYPVLYDLLYISVLLMYLYCVKLFLIVKLL